MSHHVTYSITLHPGTPWLDRYFTCAVDNVAAASATYEFQLQFLNKSDDSIATTGSITPDGTTQGKYWMALTQAQVDALDGLNIYHRLIMREIADPTSTLRLLATGPVFFGDGNDSDITWQS